MAQESYTVKSGDTLSKIASQYGVDISNISGYRSGNPDLIYSGENLSINKPDLPAPNTINANDLNAKPYTAPPTVPKTGYAGLIESTNSVIQDLTPKVDQGAKDIQGIYDKLGGQSTKKADLYTSEGVYDKEAEYKKVTNQITAKDAAYRRKIEKIQEENPTGQLSEGQNIAIAKVEREWAREKADLSIVAAFARDDYTTAKQIVDDKIAAETEDLTTQLSGLQFFYSQNFNRLTDAQKTLVQQQTTQVENELSDKKSLLENIGNIQLTAAQNGAPADVIVKIGKSGDVTQAISAAGTYLQKASGANAITFSDTQIANGAANAGVALSDFTSFDKDTQNFFINGDISGTKKTIDSAFTNDGASLDEVKTTIQDMNLPQKGEEYLIQYAEQSSKDNAPLSVEDRITSLKGEDYTRAEAKKQAESELSDNGKYEIPKAVQKSIDDALVKVYGRTFWQKVLPGGR